MKKFAAVLLALCLLLCSVSALAEEAADNFVTYMMVGYQDAEGNVTTVDETMVLYLVIDLEGDECAFGTTDKQLGGTYEITETTDEYAIVVMTLEDGQVVTMIYVIEDDSFAMQDEATGLTAVLMNLEAVEAALADEAA